MVAAEEAMRQSPDRERLCLPSFFGPRRLGGPVARGWDHRRGGCAGRRGGE